MFCRHCGKELQDDDRACPYCGTMVRKKVDGDSGKKQITTGFSEEQEGAAEKKDSETVIHENHENYENHENGNQPEPKKKNRTVWLLAGLGILAAAAGAGIFAGRLYAEKNENPSQNISEIENEAESADGNRSETGEAKEQDKNGASEETADTASAAGEIADTEWARAIAKCNSGAGNSFEQTIDVFAENYEPGARNMNYAWDRTLFYTLEDVNPDSISDGKINGYEIRRKVFKNAVTGNKMEYEIYASPVNGNVNKIVSIEYFENYLEITDYYYDDNGKVSFIFVRNDTNYVPSYAVPTKDGKRFYFYQDCMTKWRTVSGGAQTNYVLGQASANEGSNPAGSVFLYDALSSPQQDNYDVMERRMINAAYNTYRIVLEAESLSEITGYVYDEDGTPLMDAAVMLQDGAGGDNLYLAATDENGLYQITVPAEEYSYQMHVSYGNCVPVKLYGIYISDQTLSEYQSPVYMVEESRDKLPVNLQAYDALNYASDGNGMERLSNAEIFVRRGINHKTGAAEFQGTADSGGSLSMELNPGMYTAEVQKPGYDNTYYNFAVRRGMETVQINASPKLASGEVRVVLTWGEVPSDLDSHLFTPYDSTFGDTTYHIWYGNKQDSVGNNLDVDDTSSYGPETMTIPALKNGLYKYYVADFTNCCMDFPSSYDMSNSGATVNVYTEGGLAASFAVPANRPGVIWEVFEIRNGSIVPIQRYYSNIDDKDWWHSDK